MGIKVGWGKSIPIKKWGGWYPWGMGNGKWGKFIIGEWGWGINIHPIAIPTSELEPDDNGGERIKRKLFFMNGDWDQDSGGAPLLPFNDHDIGNTFGNGPPLKLVSFWVMDVDRVRQAKNAVSVSGILDIGISRSSSFSYKPYDWSPKYNHQGVSSLTVLFEGIYTESEENGGERLMCLLGNATMPTSQFDDSMLGSDLKYQFGSEELLSKASSPYPYQDNLVDEEVEMKDGGANDQHHKLGPFVLGGRKTEATDGDLDNFRLMVQDLRCEPGNNLTEIRTARVSSVFRSLRHAEGRWRSSDGQLCMVSCRAFVGAPSDSCNSQICLYLPRTFSIKQRSTDMASLSLLSDVLSPHLFVIPHTMPNPRTPRSYVDVEVLSLASLFGRYRRQLQEEKLEVEKPFHLNAE
ncbi:hypothetical protein HYC85_026204 [Camellia sinensis]|uniref:DUF2921 domain-containing protein n=1 Tax=Camellia sinensis TaxID=4442 RepID=A0A7J7G455_CAMSI|nr:hypothetical protein HYC85_026204 [Camellia sinensis]